MLRNALEAFGDAVEELGRSLWTQFILFLIGVAILVLTQRSQGSRSIPVSVNYHFTRQCNKGA